MIDKFDYQKTTLVCCLRDGTQQHCSYLNSPSNTLVKVKQLGSLHNLDLLKLGLVSWKASLNSNSWTGLKDLINRSYIELLYVLFLLKNVQFFC